MFNRNQQYYLAMEWTEEKLKKCSIGFSYVFKIHHRYEIIII